MFINVSTGSTRRGLALNPVEDTLVSIENVVGGSKALCCRWLPSQ
jgi:hypothetical protein